MAEEPGLPKLMFDTAEALMAHYRPHKRVKHSPSVSSDPPTFSSDDDPSADNYVAGRRKRIYRGPWYRQESTSEATSNVLHGNENPQGTKRSLRRQFDSGVFMASDGTDAEECEDEFMRQSEPSGQAKGESIFTIRSRRAEPLSNSESLNSQRFEGNLDTSYGSIHSSNRDVGRLWDDCIHPVDSLSRTRLVAPFSTSEFLVNKRIESYLETGNEIIDLSNRNLTHVLNESIRPLASFIRIPNVTQDNFASLEPHLKIFLSSNKLTALPGELFNLPHLTELSVRNNDLRELPPAITNSKSLVTLNLAGNRLALVPYEILDLFLKGTKLEECRFHPNPFYQLTYPSEPLPKDSCSLAYKIGLSASNRSQSRPETSSRASPDQRLCSWSPQWDVRYDGRTEVRYFDINGTHLKGPFLYGDKVPSPHTISRRLSVVSEDDIPTPPAARDRAISRVPSLLEVSLQACSAHPQLPFLEDYLPVDAPSCIPLLLKMTLEKRQEGGSKCTICKRNFIVKRTEWIEWWTIRKAAKDDGAGGGLLSAASPLGMIENGRDSMEECIPMVRRGCSWKCGPEKLKPDIQVKEGFADGINVKME